MDVRITKTGQIVIAEVDGRIDGTSAAELDTKVGAVIPDADQGLICDLSGVSYVSSAGLRVILIIAKRLSNQNSAFSICGLSEQVNEVFRISGFHKIVSIYKTREEALVETGSA